MVAQLFNGLLKSHHFRGLSYIRRLSDPLSFLEPCGYASTYELVQGGADLVSVAEGKEPLTVSHGRNVHFRTHALQQKRESFCQRVWRAPLVGRSPPQEGENHINEEQ